MLQVTRRWWLLASLSAPFAAALGAQQLEVRLDSGNLVRISAPAFQFLSGKPLERLKNGSSVSFLGQLSISTDANRTIQERALTRFALSYDIWEQKFAAVKIAEHPDGRRAVSHLSADAMETWCIARTRWPW